MSDMSAEERRAEVQVRSEQMAAILELMREKPEHFGAVSTADLCSQMSTFYSAATA